MKEAGTGVKYEVQDNKLTVELDLTADHGDSKTGKTRVIGSTNGFLKLTHGEREVMFSLNCNFKPRV